MTIYATHVSPFAKSIYEVDWTESAAIMVGNEHRGVSDKALKIADQTVYVPMFGMVESLNVSVATAVLLYEACRQRIQKEMYPLRQETDDWFNKTLASWIKSGS